METGVKNVECKPMLAQLREMEVGDRLVFPAERTGSVKTMCSGYGFQWGRVYATRTDRAARTIEVVRKA